MRTIDKKCVVLYFKQNEGGVKSNLPIITRNKTGADIL